MKKLLLLSTFLMIGLSGFAQSNTPANQTQEQRMTQAQDKKSKGGKKNLTMEQKVKIAKKQNKKARKAKSSKKARPPKPKM